MTRVTEFMISPDTARALRDDIRKYIMNTNQYGSSGGADITTDEAKQLAHAAEKVPLFVLAALKDGSSLVGVEETLASQTVPVPCLQPLALVGAAIFIGEGSCHAGMATGPYIRWLPCP